MIVLRGRHLDVAVRDQCLARNDGFLETYPADKLGALHWNRSVFQNAVDPVDPELVGDKEVGNQRLITRLCGVPR